MRLESKYLIQEGGGTVQVRLLKAELAKNGKTQTWLAKQLGISSQTLSKRMQNGYFTVQDAELITELLDIKNPVEIFLQTSSNSK